MIYSIPILQRGKVLFKRLISKHLKLECESMGQILLHTGWPGKAFNCKLATVTAKNCQVNRYWGMEIIRCYTQVREGRTQTQRHFIAITDPGYFR